MSDGDERKPTDPPRLAVAPPPETREVAADADLSDPEVRLSHLRAEHRQLDAEIESLQLLGKSDFEIMNLKRRKLQIKDEIAWLVAKIRPDIIA